MARERINDPIAVELMRNVVDSLCDEMAVTVLRTARSQLAKDALDFSTGIANPRGELLACGLGRFGHVGAIHLLMRSVMKLYPREEMKPGDIFVCNDPYEGALHLPDVFLIQPAFWNGTCVAFAITALHHTDVGGRVPGGNAADSTEIYQEGLRLPPLKLYSKGVPDSSLFRLIEKNVRTPDEVIGDLKSQASACAIGVKGIVKLVSDHGLENYHALTESLLDYSEELTRAEIRTWPDGTYDFTDFADGDGFDSGPIRLHLTMTKKGDDITLDWTGSSPQVKGSINATYADTIYTTAVALRCAFVNEPQLNYGFLRPFRIIAPPGSVLNPLPPAAFAARGVVRMRIEDVVWGAMSRMVPDKIPACSIGLDTGLNFYGHYPNGRHFVHTEFLAVSWGGRPYADGIDGTSRPAMSFSNAPVEILEAEQPLMVEEYAFLPNSGGAGKFRGGLAMTRSYRLVGVDECLLQIRSDRQRFLPYGLAGGRPGTPSRNLLNPGKDDQILPSKGRVVLKRGDLFQHNTAGAAGWGDPLDRDPERVLTDVQNQKLTVDHVEREYGVIIDANAMKVDIERTEELRKALRETQVRDAEERRRS